MQGIYVIQNLIDGKCYVGKSQDIETRRKKHVRRVLNKDHGSFNKLYKAINQDGIDNFQFAILEELPNADNDELLNRETYWINKLNTIENGYNHFKRGYSSFAYWKGKSRSEKTRNKISKSLTGFKMDDSTKDKISKANKKSMIGNTNGNKRLVCVETGVIYDSINNAAKDIQRSPSGITKVLKGIKKTCGGYHWKYCDSVETIPKGSTAEDERPLEAHGLR